MRALPIILASTLALGLAGCSDPDTAESAESASTAGSETSTFDPSSLEEVAEISALVPTAIAESGELRNGASADYPPAEFMGDDGSTPTGYDVEIVEALAAVMGLEGTTSHAEFPTIIPALGTTFDIGASSFTITQERLEQVNMVSYVEVGSAWAVAEGNPSGFDPTDVCGSVIGVQNGTYQHEYAQELADECAADGKEEPEIMPLDAQTDVATRVIGGQYDATFADSTVIGYAIEQSDGQLEGVGETIDASPQGIAVAKDDTELTEAVRAGLQYLMDEGYLAQILAEYGAEDAALTTAEINPEVD